MIHCVRQIDFVCLLFRFYVRSGFSWFGSRYRFLARDSNSLLWCFFWSLSCFSSAEWEEFRNKFLQNEFSEWFAGERESRGSGWVYLSGALKVQFELWLTLKTSVGKIEGFWFENDYMTYYRHLFLKFHHCVGVIDDFSCFDLATVFGLENYQ